MNELENFPNHSGKKMPRVVIIGGLGEMGKLFHRIFKRRTEDIVIVDRETPLRPEEAVADADIVLVSVSIDETMELIEQLAPKIPPNALLMDVTSLKQSETEAMMRFSDSRVEILGTHPLFGPYHEIEGQVIVLTPVRGVAWVSYMEELFREVGLIPISVTPEQHDKLMSFVQVLLHVILFSLVGTAQKLDLDPKLLKIISTPLYKIVWTLGERILNHDSGLYRHMALSNTHSGDSLQAFHGIFEQFLSHVTDGKAEAFEKEFGNLRQFLEEASDAGGEETREQSQRLIDFFSKDFLNGESFKKTLGEISSK